MKKYFSLIIITSFNFFNLVAQDHHHCAHHCSVSKEIDIPTFTSEPVHIKQFTSNYLTHYIGSTHQHSGFSDGYPGTTPADYFQSGIDKGYDFVLGADHSDSYILPMTLHGECLSENIIDCISIDPSNPEALLKWRKFEEIVTDKTSDSFVGVRGFEWTSDRFGHINVYFTQNLTNAKTDGGYVDMQTFWNWFTTDPIDMEGSEALLGGVGGADGLGVFNHPGDKDLDESDPGFNWNGFEYIAKADSQMVGIEVFNDGRDYAHDGRTFYQEILDAGWHVGAIASVDHHDLNWNNLEDEKTVMMAKSLDHEGLKEAMYKRRTYAVRDFNLRLDFQAGKELMGSRIQRKTGSKVQLKATINTENDTYIELVSNNGEIIQTFDTNSFVYPIEVEENERWYYLRIARKDDGRSMAYSSPIWIKGGGDIVDIIKDDNDDSQTASLKEKATNVIRIFPNPVSKDDWLTVQIDGQKELEFVQLIHLNGHNIQVPMHSITGKEIKMDLRNLSSGTYNLKIKCSDMSIVQKKIVVE